MPRSTKYSLDKQDIICAAIAQFGNDRAGTEAGRISSATFYLWCREIPEFREAVDAAKDEYRRTCPAVLHRLAKDQVYQILAGNAEKVTTVEESGTSGGVPYKKSKTTRSRIIPDRWVIEHVLGPAISEVQAIQVLVTAGYFPLEVIQLTEDQLGSFRNRMRMFFNGIVPELDAVKPLALTEETAAAVRAQILFPDGFKEKAS